MNIYSMVLFNPSFSLLNKIEDIYLDSKDKYDIKKDESFISHKNEGIIYNEKPSNIEEFDHRIIYSSYNKEIIEFMKYERDTYDLYLLNLPKLDNEESE